MINGHVMFVSGLGLLVQITVAEKCPKKPESLGREAFIATNIYVQYIRIVRQVPIYGIQYIYSNREDAFCIFSKTEMATSNIWHNQQPFLFNLYCKPGFIMHKGCKQRKQKSYRCSPKYLRGQTICKEKETLCIKCSYNLQTSVQYHSSVFYVELYYQ